MAEQKDLFIKALDQQDMKALLRNDTVRQNIVSGCQMFEGKDIEKIRQKLEAAMRGPVPNGP
jgi:hypothetical protein